MFHQDQGSIVRGGAEAADAEAFALELLQLGDAGPGKNDLIVCRFYRGDEHEIKPRQIGLNHRTDIDDGWIAAGKGLGGDLAAAQKDRLDLQSILVEQA